MNSITFTTPEIMTMAVLKTWSSASARSNPSVTHCQSYLIFIFDPFTTGSSWNCQQNNFFKKMAKLRTTHFLEAAHGFTLFLGLNF